MTTLFDLTLSLSEIVAETHFGTATGGSTTTLADSTLDDPDDYYNGGTIWFRSGNNISKTAIVTDFTNATGTITFATQSLACAAGNEYAVAPKEYNRSMLRRAVNQALQDKELHYLQTDTTLTGATGTLSIALTDGVTDVRRVTVEGSPNYFWREVNGYLVFDDGYEPATGDDIVVYYVGAHAVLDSDDDELSVNVAPELVKWKAAIYALRSRYMVAGDDDPKIKLLSEQAAQMASSAWRKYRPPAMQRDPHFSPKWDND